MTTTIETDQCVVIPCNGVSLEIYEGEVLGIVGESGSGKSMTALSILRLLPPGARIGGEVLFEGRDLLALTEERMQGVRGKDIAMIFQEPMSSLNPVYSVGYQIQEAIRLHTKMGKREALERSVELLHMVNMPEARRRIRDYPHQLSGGMQQRAMIAMALACRPKLLIADEPTTALDVTIQAQILDLLEKLKKNTSMSLMLITHDLSVVSEIADWVIVMYAGRVVEEGKKDGLLNAPMHPYTKGLIDSIPLVEEVSRRLRVIPGTVPSMSDLPVGCSFASRCNCKLDICLRQEPGLFRVQDPLEEKEGGKGNGRAPRGDTRTEIDGVKDQRLVRCWLYEH